MQTIYLFPVICTLQKPAALYKSAFARRRSGVRIPRLHSKNALICRRNASKSKEPGYILGPFDRYSAICLHIQQMVRCRLKQLHSLQMELTALVSIGVEPAVLTVVS